MSSDFVEDETTPVLVADHRLKVPQVGLAFESFIELSSKNELGELARGSPAMRALYAGAPTRERRMCQENRYVNHDATSRAPAMVNGRVSA